MIFLCGSMPYGPTVMFDIHERQYRCSNFGTRPEAGVSGRKTSSVICSVSSDSLQCVAGGCLDYTAPLVGHAPTATTNLMLPPKRHFYQESAATCSCLFVSVKLIVIQVTIVGVRELVVGDIMAWRFGNTIIHI